MREPHLITQAVPRIADVFAESARHAHDDGRCEAIRRTPPHRAGVVQLLRRGIGVFAKLNFCDRYESRDRHPNRATDDPFLGETRVEHALVAELLLKSLS